MEKVFFLLLVYLFISKIVIIERKAINIFKHKEKYFFLTKRYFLNMNLPKTKISDYYYFLLKHIHFYHFLHLYAKKSLLVFSDCNTLSLLYFDLHKLLYILN